MGPVIGGALSYQWGWPAVFFFLSVYSGIVFVLIILIMEETLPYIVFEKKLSKKYPNQTNPFPVPKFEAPWIPFKHLINKNVVLLAIQGALSFAVLFNCLANILSIVLVEDEGFDSLISGKRNGLIGVHYIQDFVSFLLDLDVLLERTSEEELSIIYMSSIESLKLD